jgi:Flp pilus assembly protein TadG
MIRKITNIPKSERGQSLTELAVSLTLLLILVAGVVDIGRAFFTYIALRDAAQEGALYGSYEPAACNGIIQRAQVTSNQPFDLSSATVSVEIIKSDGTTFSCSSATPISGDQVRVTVTYNNFQVTMPFLGTLIGKQQFPISASIKDTVLNVPVP